MPDEQHRQLSIIGMIVPSNDGFVALHKLVLPSTPGTYTYMVNAYDAGTEANDEIRGGGAPVWRVCQCHRRWLIKWALAAQGLLARVSRDLCIFTEVSSAIPQCWAARVI